MSQELDYYGVSFELDFCSNLGFFYKIIFTLLYFIIFSLSYKNGVVSLYVGLDLVFVLACT